LSASQLSQVVFKLSTREPAGEVSLKPEAWRILAYVNGERTLAEIARQSGIDESTANAIAHNLLQANILEIVSGNLVAQSPYVAPSFFDQIARELARSIGPLARLIVNEAIVALGEQPTQFPRERIADLIERLSEEIPDPDRRLRFQQVMLELIRQL
jgi:hypothetical protein